MTRPPRTRPASTSPLGRPTLTPSVEPLTVGAPPPSLLPPAQSQTDGLPESVTPVVPNSVTHRVPESGSRAAAAAADPRWRQFTRKEARFRADQLDQLARLRRQLGKARTRHDETITDNTLIRVAVDLLLSRAADLRGDTEAELLESLNLFLPE